jgi:hypothetical protein
VSVGEYENEPVRGLPEYLPPGETLVWQGAPDYKTMARRVFHIRSVSIYFALLIAVHFAVQTSQGGSLSAVALGSSWMLGLGFLAVGILSLLAFAYARTTVYTLTDKRLVLRFGVAMPMMVNIPLSIITAADMRQFGDGSGDVILSLEQRKRLSYMMLWPNVRSWRINPTQPALRSLADAEDFARKLAAVVDSASHSKVEQQATVSSRGSSINDAGMLGAS